MIGQKILDEIIRQPMFRMECPAHPEAGCLAIWNGNVAEQLEAIVAVHVETEPLIIDPDYGRFISKARCIAKAEGYALALHGSFTRDLDVIAIPWVEKPNSTPSQLAHQIAGRTGLTLHPEMQPRAHGRMTWVMHFPEFGDPRYIDFSVMPLIPEISA